MIPVERPANVGGGPGGESSEALPSLPTATSKIRPRHRDRLAVVYVRQSTPQQVLLHAESAALQYDLVRRAVSLGWSRSRVLVIDEDQGRSGQSVEGRLGFQRLLAEVGLDHVGLILGLEMSRLARSCKDWHQLLELCAHFGTLLADQDGLYDPTDYNDRLLLGLKGTMSEAELHILRNRLNQGRLNKARRGELVSRVPVGYVRLPSGEVTLDPDEQVREVVRTVFDKFDELRSIGGVLRYLACNHMNIGLRQQSGPGRGELRWRCVTRRIIWDMLHHPLYAGAYSYGRRVVDPRRRATGRSTASRMVPPGEYVVLLRDRFPAYITWERHQANLRQLAENRARAGCRGVPRRGSALLAGIAVCGRCGHHMVVNYHRASKENSYVCNFRYTKLGGPVCQAAGGRFLDEFISRLALRVLEPAALELSVAAADDIEREGLRLERHWQQRLERARFESDRAARQYHAVEPENRLVARELERRWEQALLGRRQLEEEHDRNQRDQPARLTHEDRDAIRALAGDIPSLWHDAGTTHEDRKTILRHLVDRVMIAVQ